MFCTLSILIGCIIVGMIFGRELYQKRNPTAFMAQELIEYSSISARKFPLIFYFTVSTVNIDNLNSVYDISTRVLKFDVNNTASLTNLPGLIKCNESLFDDGLLKEEYKKLPTPEGGYL